MWRTIIHADMDAFFASVEQVANPDYRGKPVIVGADPKIGRGVVSASSYEARKYGVRSAMPISKAYALCPDGIFVPPDFKKYSFYSRIIIGIFRRYTPLVEQISIDEAFLDCSHSTHLFGDGAAIAQKIKKDVYDATGLTVSCGVASNKSVAKIASDLNKPDGLTICPPGREKDFLADLDIEKIWGVGEKTGKMLRQYGFRKIRDIATRDCCQIESIAGKNGEHIWMLANGIDNREVESERPDQKTFGEEHSFLRDTDSCAKISSVLCLMIDRLLRNMRQRGQSFRTMTLKIRFSDFTTITRSKTFLENVCDYHTVKEDALKILFCEIKGGVMIRLVGISFSKVEDNTQCLLFESASVKAKKREDILDLLKQRFGDKINRGDIFNFSID